MKSVRLETSLSFVLIFLSTFFISEVFHFFDVGRWEIHSGGFGFDQWPQPFKQNLAVLVHGFAMFLWVAILVYQLKTRGKKNIMCWWVI